MHLVGGDVSRLKGTSIRRGISYAAQARRQRWPGINPEASEQGGGMSMPSLKDRDPSGQVWQMSVVGPIKRE